MRIVLFDLGNTLESNDALLPGARETLAAIAALRDEVAASFMPWVALVIDFMNGKLISKEEKEENRRKRDRRRRLRTIRRHRAALVAELEAQPAMLALVNGGVIGDDAFLRLYGRMDQARKVVNELKLALALADFDPNSLEDPAGPGEKLLSPTRCLQGSRRGNPGSIQTFQPLYREAVRYARALEQINLIPRFQGTIAYFDSPDLEALLVGIQIPRNLRRQKFLARILHGHQTTPSVEIFSSAGTPLFLHPLPAGFLTYGCDQPVISTEEQPESLEQ